MLLRVEMPMNHHRAPPRRLHDLHFQSRPLDEWLPMFGDPMRAQSAIYRLTGNAYDLVIEGESYRQRLSPRS
jgi:hypothetical protein